MEYYFQRQIWFEQNVSLFNSSVVVCRSSSLSTCLWSASLSAGHVTRDQAVMTCVTQTWRGFSRLNVTNYEYIQGTINLFNCPGKVTHWELGNKKHNGHLMTSGVMCPVTGAGERLRGVIMIDISAGDTSAIWHVRWQGITRKIRLGRAGQQIRKIYSAHLKKHSPNTWLVIELVTK